MSALRAIQTDTAPPPGMTLGEPPVMKIVTGPDTDWTKVHAYVPNTNTDAFSANTALSAAINAHILSGNAVYCTHLDADHVPPGAGRTRNMRIFQRNRIVVYLDEVNHTATANTFSIVCNGARADQYTIPTGWYGGVSTEMLDPLAGYEVYQHANWDGHDAKPITAATLAYARKLLRVMPTTLGTPDIAPAGDGSIVLEWVPEDTTHKLDKLFLDIGPGEEWRAYWKLRNGTFGRSPNTGFSDQTKTILKNIFDDLSA